MGFIAGVAAMVAGGGDVCCCMAQVLTLDEQQSNVELMCGLLTAVILVNDCCQVELIGDLKKWYGLNKTGKQTAYPLQMQY